MKGSPVPAYNSRNALDEGLDDVQRNFKRVDGSLINVVEIVGVDDLDACFVLEAGAYVQYRPASRFLLH